MERLGFASWVGGDTQYFHYFHCHVIYLSSLMQKFEPSIGKCDIDISGLTHQNKHVVKKISQCLQLTSKSTPFYKINKAMTLFLNTALVCPPNSFKVYHSPYQKETLVQNMSVG